MSLPARVTTLVIAFLAVVAGGIFVALHYIGAKPPTVDYTSVASRGQVNVTMMTTPQTTVTDKPDWVSYFIQNPQTKEFVHTTYFEVPADTQVNITILGYDGCTPLRNPVWGKVTGTVGNVEVTRYYNGKAYSAPQAISLLDSWADCSVQHTFAIPGLGLSVPVASPNTVAENNALCGTSPCVANTADQALAPHTVVRFSFKTPKAGGTFRWQCFVPCGGGFVDGNGGPMGTPGYMMGQMEVQA
ncbi:MAG: hypothetical protein ACRDQ1_15880 [Sciscionella sp.]